MGISAGFGIRCAHTVVAGFVCEVTNGRTQSKQSIGPLSAHQLIQMAFRWRADGGPLRCFLGYNNGPNREKACLLSQPATSENNEHFHAEILASIHFSIRKQITITLIRLRRCTGWSAPLLFAGNKSDFFVAGPNVRQNK